MEEIWKDVVGYEGLYEISNMGNIRKLPTITITSDGRVQHYKGHNLNLTKDKDGYYRVWLRKDKQRKAHFIHRLVYEAFIGDIPQDKVINHIDCNKNNNHIENLECITQQENVIHGIENGCHKNWRNQYSI